MLINKVIKITGLTRKAIDYYEQKGLIKPTILENGYRDFSKIEVEQLKQIAFLRSLDLSVDQIKEIFQLEQQESISWSLLRQRELQLKINAKKLELFKQYLKEGYSDKLAELAESINQTATIAERIEQIFPGYFGQIFINHYLNYLLIPLQTASQKSAFAELVFFLDKLPNLDLTNEQEQYLAESTNNVDLEFFDQLELEKQSAINNVEQWFEQNKENLQTYFDYKNSELYKATPLYEIEEKLKTYFQETSYHETVIPLLRKISPAYDRYYKQLLTANSEFLQNHPEFNG